MGWDDLRFFLAVAREQSLAAAGRTLRVSAATVMRRVGALEEALGVRLFTHHREGYALTSAGEELLVRAGRVEDEVGSLERALTGRDTRLSGTVRLATSENLAALLVVPALTRFHRAHPDIRVELALGVRAVGLSRREADLALRLVRPQQADLVVRRLGTVGFAVYGAAGMRTPRVLPAGDAAAAPLPSGRAGSGSPRAAGCPHPGKDHRRAGRCPNGGVGEQAPPQPGVRGSS
jgi:DNA-binding transcriptional LysR family regulator